MTTCKTWLSEAIGPITSLDMSMEQPSYLSLQPAGALLARVLDDFAPAFEHDQMDAVRGVKKRVLRWLVQTLSGSSDLRLVGSKAAYGAVISPARGPPLWDDCDAYVGEGVAAEPAWDLTAQSAPDYEVDQRINW